MEGLAMRSLPYAHLLASLRTIADWCGRYNTLTRPSAYKTDDEHQRDGVLSQDIARQLRPYILLGVVRESESGRMWLSDQATREQ